MSQKVPMQFHRFLSINDHFLRISSQLRDEDLLESRTISRPQCNRPKGSEGSSSATSFQGFQCVPLIPFPTQLNGWYHAYSQWSHVTRAKHQSHLSNRALFRSLKLPISNPPWSTGRPTTTQLTRWEPFPSSPSHRKSLMHFSRLCQLSWGL